MVHVAWSIGSIAKPVESLHFWIIWGSFKIVFCKSEKGSESLIIRDVSLTHYIAICQLWQELEMEKLSAELEAWNLKFLSGL